MYSFSKSRCSFSNTILVFVKVKCLYIFECLIRLTVLVMSKVIYLVTVKVQINNKISLSEQNEYGCKQKAKRQFTKGNFLTSNSKPSTS